MQSVIDIMQEERATAHDDGAQCKSCSAGKRTNVRQLCGAVFSFLFCIPILCTRLTFLLAPLPYFDLITYWAAARLFLSGGEPYSMQAMFAVEKLQGWPYKVPLVMLNPPWALALVTPLALLPFQVAHHICFLVSIVVEVVCSLALWEYFGGERRLRWMALIVLATFLPAAAAEHFGQITPLVLGAVTVFLFALRRQKYVLAGLCLTVFAVKPHLFYLVFAAALLWSVQNRKWQVPVAAIVAAGTAALAALAYNHKVAGYFGGMVGAALDTRCGLGGTLRSGFGNEHVWLQFVPCAFGLAWFTVYWIRHRRAWSWQDQMPLLLLISISTSAYFWPVDFVIGLPAMIALTIRAKRNNVLPIATVLYAVVQLIIVNGRNAAVQCLECQLWVVLYWVVVQLRVPKPVTETLAPSAELA